MINKELMVEDLPSAIIEKLLEYDWFEAMWYSLEEENQEEVMMSMSDVIAEWIDEDSEEDENY